MRVVWLLAGVLVVAAGIAVALIVGSGDDGGGSAGTTQASQSSPSGPPASAGPVVRMQRLNSTHGRGTARILHDSGRLRLRLRAAHFLVPRGGGYAVWLFRAARPSRRLYATTSTTINRDLPLPRDFSRYRYVEVARATPSLTSSYSGISLLRAPVSALMR